MTVIWVASVLFCHLIRAVAEESCSAPRATKLCDDCFWKVHIPQSKGNYSLLRTFDSAEAMARDWACYAGRTGTPSSAMYALNADGLNTGQSSQANFAHDFMRDYFYEVGPQPLTYADLIYDSDFGVWLEDPTAGMNKYRMGCAYLSDLLTPRDDGRSGFAMRAMRPMTFQYDYTRQNTDWKASVEQDVYTLRLQSKDAYNGGFFAISVDKMPYGGAAWPAFWMVGERETEWLINQPMRKGLGIRSRWPENGEIDIIEYANAHTREHRTRNAVTLHEPPGCLSERSSPSGRGLLDYGYDDCYKDKALKGCSIEMGEDTVGSPEFAGAIYACEWAQNSDRTPDRVDCWFFRKPDNTSSPPPPVAPPATTIVVRVTVTADSEHWSRDDSLVLWTPEIGWTATFSTEALGAPPSPPSIPEFAPSWKTGRRTYIASFFASASGDYDIVLYDTVDGAKVRYSLHELAGFGLIRLYPSDQWTLTAHLRLTRDGEGLAAEMGVASNRTSLYNGPMAGGAVTLLLTIDEGLQFLRAPSIALLHRNDFSVTANFAPLVEEQEEQEQEARPLCGSVSSVVTNGYTCQQHAQYRLDMGLAHSSFDAEMLTAIAFPACAPCTAAAPSPPPAPPSTAQTYVADMTPRSLASFFRLTLSGALDSWSGYGVGLHDHCPNCPESFEYNLTEGTRTTFDIEVTLRQLSQTDWVQTDSHRKCELYNNGGSGLVDTDIDGTSLKSVLWLNDDACCQACTETYGCEGFVGFEGRCYLKGDVGTSFGSAARTAFVRYLRTPSPPPAPPLGSYSALDPRVQHFSNARFDAGCAGFAIAADVDTDGTTLLSLAGSPRVCCEACARDVECVGYVMLHETCYLKSDVSATFASAGRQLYTFDASALVDDASLDRRIYVDVRLHECRGNERMCHTNGDDRIYAMIEDSAGTSRLVTPLERTQESSSASGVIGDVVHTAFLGAQFPSFAASNVMNLDEPSVLVLCLATVRDMVSLEGNGCQDVIARYTLSDYETGTTAIRFGFHMRTPIESEHSVRLIGTSVETFSAPPTPPPAPPPVDDALRAPLAPIDFATAETVDTSVLGPPDVRHDLKPGCSRTDALNNMVMILNTVVCGNWAGNEKATAMEGDDDGISFDPQFIRERAECVHAVREYLKAQPLTDGVPNYIDRWEWVVDWIKVWT